MAELIYRNVKNLPAVASKDDMNESDAIIVVQDETTKQATFADVRDAVIDLIDYSDVGADSAGSADKALENAKIYTDRVIESFNTDLSEDIANNTTAIQDLTTYADDTFETKTEATQSHTDILNTVTNTYATKTENAKTLTDAKAYTDREIGALNTSVASTYATKVENNQTLSDAKAYTDTEINKLDAALSKDIADNASAIQTLSDNTDASIEALTKNVTDNYATKVENAQTLTDAKSYTDDEISSLDAKLTESISANASGIQTLATDVATNYATKVENAQTLTDAKSYTDSEISTLNISLSADIADNASDIQALAKNVTDNYATKVENNQSLTDAKTYTDEEISTLNTSLSADITALSTNVTTNYATKVENAQSLTDAKAYTDSEISSLDTSLSADISSNATAIQNLSTNVTTNYATKTENAKSLTDAKAYTDSEISTLNTSLSADISSNATAIQNLSTNVTNNYVKKTDTIGKATADASGNVITTTYATKTENAQSLTDAKAYTDDEISKLIGTAPDTLDTLGEISEALKNNAGIVDSIIAQIPTKVSQLTNDSAYITKNSDITGTAAKATADGAGQQINSTYIKGLSASGTTLTITKGNGTTSTISTQDKNVTNTLATTTKAYVTGTTSATSNTGTQVFDTGVYLDTTAGSLVADTVRATTFTGALSGNASSASKLQTARTIALTGSVTGSGTFDGSGNLSIATTTNHTHSYLPLSGGTLTGGLAIKPASGEGGQIDLEASTSNTTENSIVLDQWNGKFRVFGRASADGTTVTGSGTPLVIDPYAKTITGGYTITGTLTGNAATASKLTTARTIALTGSVTGSGTFDGSGNLSITTTTNHTHSYAGSASAGGAATKAISDNAGQQIDTTYIKGLSVSGTTLTITKGDGSTSTLTTHDTTYGVATSTSNGLMSATDKAIFNNMRHIIELNTDAYYDSNGGAIDFHYAGSTDDYTSRIIEVASGQISINGVRLNTDKSVTATTFVGALSGNASTATKLATARTIALTGSVTGSGTFDGSGNLSIATTTNHTHTKSQITDFSVGLSSEDLNTIKTTGFYYAGGANTVTNKPSDVDAFGLLVIRSANGWYTQILYSSNNPNVQKPYTRLFYGSEWTQWQENKITDNNVTNTLATTTKAYITGTTSATTNTGTQVFDTGVYLDTTAGGLNATSYKVAEKVTMIYDSTEECLSFAFV